jgi:hypothetical protein
MRITYGISVFVTGVVVCVLLASAGILQAGNLDSPGAPGATSSYTLEDIYSRLNSGTAGTQGNFTEPTSGPTAGTMHTLNDIMGKAPVVDASGASAGDVLSGKTFWGLTSGGWGPRIGTVTAGANVTGANGAKTVTIPDGLYSGSKTATAGDTNLVTGNIKSGVSVFGVAGSVQQATGDAGAGDVLTGKTFSNSTATGVSGTMFNIGTQNITPGTSAQTISQGYHNGSGTVTGDADLVTGNIRASTIIFGVSGKTEVVDTTSGTAAAGDILSGKTAWVDGMEITGSITTKTLSAASDTVAAGYYEATTLHAVDADLAEGNIKKNVNIFGVVGTYEGGGGSASVPKTGQTPTVPQNPAAAGSDGALQKGVAWPNPRFTDNGNGTVTDNMTGLIWLKNANCFGQRNWTTALSDCATLNSGGCGLTDGSVEGDWRLPNIRELFSLIDFRWFAPGLCNTAGTAQWSEGDPFTGVRSDYYWSSTTHAGATGYAWAVHLSDGFGISGLKTYTYFVWPVRGGQ